MNFLTISFLIALAAETGARLFLSTRQIAAARVNRDKVPEAFRDRIALADQARAADYTLARVWLGRWATGFEALLRLLLTLGGGLRLIDAAVSRLALAEPWRGTVLMLAVFAVLQLLSLPFSIYRTFGIEARFGFNRTTPALYATDLLKQWALALTIGTPALLAVLSIMQYTGANWWYIAWLAWLVFMFIATWAVPRFIAPLFNRFSPLADAALKARLITLCQRCGFVADGGLYVIDASRRSAHGNAYFTGIGRNKRIVLFDTLLTYLDHAELEAVLAHELGHFKLHHIRQQLIVGVIASFTGFAVLSLLAAAPQFYSAFHVSPSPAMALLLFLLVVPAFTYFTTPLQSWWSRRHEFEADRFAAAHADARQLSNALVKLHRDNASMVTPDPLYSSFYDSHPPALTRISHLNESSPA